VADLLQLGEGDLGGCKSAEAGCEGGDLCIEIIDTIVTYIRAPRFTVRFCSSHPQCSNTGELGVMIGQWVSDTRQGSSAMSL
jgi:hypothetical protein